MNQKVPSRKMIRLREQDLIEHITRFLIDDDYIEERVSDICSFSGHGFPEELEGEYLTEAQQEEFDLKVELWYGTRNQIMQRVLALVAADLYVPTGA
jgi:hypothetical protein